MTDKDDFSAALNPAAPDGATILANERARSSIPVEKFSRYLLTSKYIEQQNRILKANLARPDLYKLALARAKWIRQLKDKVGWNDDEYQMAATLCDDVLPYYLHTAIFIATVLQQGSAAQKVYWMPKLEAWEVIGAYAQTELGHGSNVRGLELEARWDPRTKEFVLHSPHLTASKWWNGTMGRTANYVIAVAQLLLPVSGSGAETKVDPETGEYTKPKNPEVVYGSLTHVRAKLVMEARLALARAVTVAVRYLSIRRQFKDKDALQDTAPEINVLDYPTVQFRILPLLATTFPLHYSGKAMGKLYERTRTDIERSGDFAALAELYSTSSGLKSLCTDISANSIETFEGDNYMITQQVARYLIKKVRELESLRRFLASKDTKLYLSVLTSDEDIVEAFEWRAAYLSFKAYEKREIQKQTWNSLLIDFYRLSRAHSQSILVIKFYNAINNDSNNIPSAQTRSTLRDLFRLFALSTMETEAREFYSCGAISNEHLDAVTPRVFDLMQRIRPHVVSLVDAWIFCCTVYEELFELAHRQNPLNEIIFNPDYRTDELVLGSGDAGQILSKL
ncbi:acyl-CoA oxidase [Blastomyces dermatitidis ER-3]|uniref:Acyl-coenzyme A oxidase n=1 Tax=Ajellomyces dermatitidis (strain ER-3 / ATCC MYA-2586) TaxID=559297 RepID=A0ABP2EQ76_AJEDR|nr:acyl-CoA oxidase [Blastomyces dermatitidis ER-3]EEQ85754.2 acyl-CoA oxidase [Blastomyces dermatitidis ER-3]